MAARHFLTLNDMTTTELEDLVDHGTKLRNEWRQGIARDSLKNRVLAMIFEKSSTRTRVSLKPAWLNLAALPCFFRQGTRSLAAGSQ